LILNELIDLVDQASLTIIEKSVFNPRQFVFDRFSVLLDCGFGNET
jgi:hypothetical protein